MPFNVQQNLSYKTAEAILGARHAEHAVARVDARPAALARLLGVLRSQSRSVCAGAVSRARERGAPVERLEAAFESLMSP